MFRLNQNKEYTNRSSLIGSIFCYFYRKFRAFPVFIGFFPVFFGLFRNSLFQLFRFYTETESFDVSIEPKTNRRPTQTVWKRVYLGNLQKNLGLFRFVSVTKQFYLFRLFRYRFETLKQTELFLFWVSQNKPKQTRNRSCFALFRFEPKFIFACFEDTLVTMLNRKSWAIIVPWEAVSVLYL